MDGMKDRLVVVAPIARLARVGSQMQEVRGSTPRLGGSGVSPSQASGGMGTLQSRASGLQSTARGILHPDQKDPLESTKSIVDSEP